MLSGAFERHIFKDPKVVEEIVKFMDQGSKTNQMLNTLILIDIEVWNNEQLQSLIEKFDNFIEESFDTNNLMLSENPLMSIALSAQLLERISISKKRFES